MLRSFVILAAAAVGPASGGAQAQRASEPLLSTGLLDALFGENTVIEVRQDDGTLRKVSVSKAWLKKMEAEGRMTTTKAPENAVHVRPDSHREGLKVLCRLTLREPQTTLRAVGALGTLPVSGVVCGLSVAVPTVDLSLVAGELTIEVPDEDGRPLAELDPWARYRAHAFAGSTETRGLLLVHRADERLERALELLRGLSQELGRELPLSAG